MRGRLELAYWAGQVSCLALWGLRGSFARRYAGNVDTDAPSRTVAAWLCSMISRLTRAPSTSRSVRQPQGDEAAIDLLRFDDLGRHRAPYGRHAHPVRCRLRRRSKRRP